MRGTGNARGGRRQRVGSRGVADEEGAPLHEVLAALVASLCRELVPRQAAFALFSNAVRSRAFWGTPLRSPAIQVV